MAVQGDLRRPPPAIARCDTRELLDNCPAWVTELFHYRDSLRRDHRMPARAGFLPEALLRHLSGRLLVDDQGIGICRYRVAGADEVRLRGHDPIGQLVQEGFFCSSLKDALECYKSIRSSRRHLYEISEFVSPEGRWRAEYAIILPFSEESETVIQVLDSSLARSPRDR